MSFYPATTSPEQAALDRLEAILRTGDPAIHDPLPPAWASGPCPAGHYCVPAGATLHRYDVPSTIEAAIAINLAVDGNNIERHLEDNRYWLIPVKVMVASTRDEEADGEVIRELVRDLFQLFTVDTANQTARERLSSDAIHVWYIQEMDVQPDTIANGRGEHTISFTLFCCGKVPAPTP